MRSLVIALAATAALLGMGPQSATAAESEVKLPAPGWSFDGMLGTFDPAAQQRGFQVFSEVCSACHALKHIYYRNLKAIGFSDDEVKAIAAAVQVTDGPNDAGEMFERPGRASDRFKAPFANDNAARAGNNGALPPDLSLIVKAREGGANYVYGILTGYADAPADVKLTEGMNFNKYFPGHQIAMPQPLTADRVTYSDGTKTTLEQEAHDVVTFLAWAAEPEMATRKQLGIKVLIFLVVLSGLLFFVKRKVWKDVH